MKTESRNRWRTLQGNIARSLVSARSLGWSKPGPRMENVAASRRHGLADQRGGCKNSEGNRKRLLSLGLELLESEGV